jgi:hypothetical protein
MVKMKKYVVELIDGYFVMMARIDLLCKTAVNAMLVVERSKTDPKYKGKKGTGFSPVGKGSHKEYKQYDKDGNFIQRAEGDRDVTEEREMTPRQKIKAGTQDIKQAMRKQRFHL